MIRLPTFDDWHTIMEDQVSGRPVVLLLIVWQHWGSNVAASLHLLKHLQHAAHPCCVPGKLHYLLHKHTNKVWRDGFLVLCINSLKHIVFTNLLKYFFPF